jgi:hypothetical protein
MFLNCNYSCFHVKTLLCKNYSLQLWVMPLSRHTHKRVQARQLGTYNVQKLPFPEKICLYNICSKIKDWSCTPREGQKSVEMQLTNLTHCTNCNKMKVFFGNKTHDTIGVPSGCKWESVCTHKLLWTCKNNLVNTWQWRKCITHRITTCIHSLVQATPRREHNGEWHAGDKVSELHICSHRSKL